MLLLMSLFHTILLLFHLLLVIKSYNILKCFVLIDLKTNQVTHQDIGQMDMYVRMYDELKKSKEDNPTIGILLCPLKIFVNYLLC